MYTSVKIRVEAKRRLEELQARLRLHGVKASLHDILEKLIELGLSNEELLVNEFKRGQEDPMLRLLENPPDWNIRDASIKIDEVLYGEGHGSIHRYRDIRCLKK